VFLPTIYTWLDAMRVWPGKVMSLVRWIGRKLSRPWRRATA